MFMPIEMVGTGAHPTGVEMQGWSLVGWAPVPTRFSGYATEELCLVIGVHQQWEAATFLR